MNLWQELRITMLQLQCHLWIVSLLMEDHLGWSHQAQQVACPRVVWISLLTLDAVCSKPGTDFHGGTRILVYRQIPYHPISWMHGLFCVSVSMSYCVCIPFLEEYSVTNTVLVSSCVCQALHSFRIEGNSFNAISVVDLWMVGKWVRGYLTQVQLPHHEDQSQK